MEPNVEGRSHGPVEGRTTRSPAEKGRWYIRERTLHMTVGVLMMALALTLMISLSIMGADMDDVETRSTRGPTDNSYMDLASYNGSTECGTCHVVAHDEWKDSFHPKKMRVADDSTVEGEWNTDLVIEVAPGVTVTARLLEDNGEYSVDLDKAGTDVYVIDFVLGGVGWEQRFMTQIGQSHYILPIQWNLATEEWVSYEPQDWYDTSSGEPRSVAKDRSWDLRCAGCHVTGAQIEYNDTSEEWIASYEELGIGCEACHGPGSLHIDPPDGGSRKDYIWSSVDSTLCGSCHNRGESVGMVGGEHTGYSLDEMGDYYLPGDDLDLFFTSIGIYYPDGRTSKVHRQQYPDYTGHPHSDSLSTIKESDRGSATCLKCHSTDYMLAPSEDKPTIETAEFNIECVACHGPHGTTNDHDLRIDREQVCSQCHRTFDTLPGGIVHHPQTEMVAGIIQIDEIEGSPWMDGEAVCADCHMPLVATSAVDFDIASHSFYFISPEKSIDLDMPNSCTVACHGPGGAGSTLTDEEALQHINDWRDATVSLLPGAEDSVEAAWEALEAAEGYGFSEKFIKANLDTYNESLLAKDYVVSDGTMVHNHEFAAGLLDFAVVAGDRVVANLTPGRIIGHIHDTDGKAVDGAEIRIGDTVWATTTEEGGFEILIAPGEYTFDIYEDDDLTLTFDANSPTGGDTNDLGVIKYEGNGDGSDYGVLIWSLIIAAVIAAAFTVWLLTSHKKDEAE